MPDRRRDKGKERVWQEVVRKQLASGMSQAKFCRANGLNENQFSYWSRALKARNKLVNREEIARASNKPQFAPMVIAGERSEQEIKVDGRAIEVQFEKRAIVRIEPGVDEDTLIQLSPIKLGFFCAPNQPICAKVSMPSEG
jgi:transposase-like protein